MSFLRKFGRTKSVDTPPESEKYKENVKRRSYSGSLPFKDDKATKERKNSVKDKKKSKSESDGNNKKGEMRYPLFYVHYLGRIPTKLEYGHESIEGPVDQLSKLREKEKLPKLVLTFNTDGLFFREITGPFNRVKKEGLFIYIPLYMVTYGVGSLQHPNVFACVTRTTSDKQSKEMFIVHAFLCEKTSVAQKMTYWQLQAYIEAYETLKRKKELRMQRRMKNSLKADTSSIKTSTTSVSLSSQEGSITSRDSERKQLDISVFTNDEKSSSGNEIEKGTPTYATVHKNGTLSTKKDDIPKFKKSEPERNSETSNGSQTSKDSALGEELSSEQIADATASIESHPTEEVDPFSFGKAMTPMANSRIGEGDGEFKKDSSTDDNLDTISVVTMPMDSETVPRDLAFEKRISELNKLMEVDAEDLKSKLIKENPTLLRRMYYGTIDRHGVFHRQGINIGMDSDNSYA